MGGRCPSREEKGSSGEPSHQPSWPVETVRNVNDAPFCQYISAKELGPEGKSPCDSSLSIEIRCFWGLPSVKKKNTQTKNNSIYLFICIHYCGQELATSPRKHILFATHRWGDSSHGRSLWAAVVKGMLSCIISSRQGSWIGSLSWNSCLGWNDSQRHPRL